MERVGSGRERVRTLNNGRRQHGPPEWKVDVVSWWILNTGRHLGRIINNRGPIPPLPSHPTTLPRINLTKRQLALSEQLIFHQDSVLIHNTFLKPSSAKLPPLRSLGFIRKKLWDNECSCHLRQSLPSRWGTTVKVPSPSEQSVTSQN